MSKCVVFDELLLLFVSKHINFVLESSIELFTYPHIDEWVQRPTTPLSKSHTCKTFQPLQQSFSHDIYCPNPTTLDPPRANTHTDTKIVTIHTLNPSPAIKTHLLINRSLPYQFLLL